MRTKLLTRIYRKLKNYEWEKLPINFKGGKTGLMLFLTLYSEVVNNTHARNLSTRILFSLVRDNTTARHTILTGKLGMAWALYFLCQKEILEKNESLEGILASIRKEFMFMYYTSPLMIVDDENLFSAGIYSLIQCSDEESLERYRLEERLINLVDECERQLTLSIEGIWNPEDLPLSMLHSYLFFLQTCVEKKSFTYKANLLLTQIKERYKLTQDKPLCDDYIYQILLGEEEMLIPISSTDEALFELLGKIGFYSLLYNHPPLFQGALNQICKQHPYFLQTANKLVIRENMSLATLCGWGYGLLLNENTCL
ncbi:MAG: hypothetical protein Q4F50_06140 [Bacteroides sp.]|uniref:hypothetical protein n=1 Tax=Bacteroides sp. TaxID=29523 RepID=UPI0026E0751C|nr:hypothetical protein [Bacteroides sp.]MDO5419624.1 hypothetical protein [Bacteroides sp.]